jgi:hypothetical protein
MRALFSKRFLRVWQTEMEIRMEHNGGGGGMSRVEREDLQRLVRQREKVLISAAEQRSAELLADFENQMGSEFSFDQDEVWRKAADAADKEVRRAQALVAARCRELGIPERFAPSLHLSWNHRGYGNTLEPRNKELRRMAQTHIEAIEKRALVEIKRSCLDAQTQLALAGCTSDEARVFINSLPPIETLMPRLSFAEVAGDADPPVAEELVSPNALRQRRHREKQAAYVTPQSRYVTLRRLSEIAATISTGPPRRQKDRCNRGDKVVGC